MCCFEDIYETMLGLLIPDACVPGIENAFAAGSVCDCAYTEMLQAYLRICSRLGGQENDPDLDKIVESMEIIQKDLCRRMYLLREG